MAALAHTILPARAPIIRTCASRAESGLFVRRIPPSYRHSVVVAGPLLLIAREYATRPRSDFRQVPGRPGRYYAQKLLVLVRARSVVTVSVPRAERGFAFLFDPRDWRRPYARGYRVSDGERRVTFRACPAREPSVLPGRHRRVGRWTEFNGAVVVAGAQCVTLDVHTRRATRRMRLSFGAGRCR